MAQYPATIDLSTINGINGFKIDGAATNDSSGISVAGVGDFNHDGYLDIVVGASGHDSNSFSNNGAAYVLFGSAAGFAANIDLGALNGTNGFEIDGITGGSGFGSSVSSAGDINGDGFSDLVIGSPTEFSTSSSTTPGATYVVFGHGGSFSTLNVSALDGTNGFRIQGVHSLDRNGYSVSAAGDVNGDGISDIVIGAPQADPNGTSSGDAYVVFGRKTGFNASLDLTTLDGSNGFKIDGLTSPDQTGWSASSAGDVNGDGFTDLVLGSVGVARGGNAYAGASYVVFGHAGGFSANVDLSALNGGNGFKILGGSGGDHQGWSVSGAGDFNADGFADIVVSSDQALGDAPVAGVSYIVFGKASGFGATLDLSALTVADGLAIKGAHSFDYAGMSVKAAGDVNGDGFSDVIIGAPFADPNAHATSGAAYVVFGGTSTATIDLANLDGTNGFKINGVASNDYAGTSVSSAGDLNGDGLSDLIVSSPFADPNGHGEAGSTYVVYGRLPDAPVTRTGTNISQTLVGGTFDDTLNGLGGNDTLYSNGGNDTLNGGDGNDGFVFKGTYTTADHVDGGPGTNDQIALQGDYSGGVTLTGASITNVEAMALLPGFNYVINSDGTFGQGGTFTFWSVSMTGANGVAIDMTAENTGTTTNFHFFLGQGQDLATGSKGDDLFYGEGGRDTLTGGAGADTFAYLQPSDSSSQTFDFITDFQAGVDRFHFPAPVTAIDSQVNGGQLDLATFDADMTAAIGAGQLAAGHAVLFAPDAGSLAGHLFLIAEASGVAGYQAGLDYAIDVTGGTLAGLSTADFI